MLQALRIIAERRTGKDRRRVFRLHRFFYKGPERRKALSDRRAQKERRDGWFRISKWSSVNLQDLKINSKNPEPTVILNLFPPRSSAFIILSKVKS
jgi:hypothetical protein